METSTATARPPAMVLTTAALTLAVVAGVLEALIVVGEIGDGSFTGAVAAQLGLRSVVYAVAFALIHAMWRGRPFGWWGAFVLLGVLGLGSMVIPGLAGVAGGDGWWDSFGGDVSPWFPPLRWAHVGLVVVGVIAMLQPAARRHVTS
jgi:hypothetical protein